MPRREPVIPSLAAASSPFTVEENTEGHLITWHVGDLPPRGTETGGESFAVITDECVDEVYATWSVTARGVDHVFQGEMCLRCKQESGVHLTFGRGRQE